MSSKLTLTTFREKLKGVLGNAYVEFGDDLSLEVATNYAWAEQRMDDEPEWRLVKAFMEGAGGTVGRLLETSNPGDALPTPYKGSLTDLYLQQFKDDPDKEGDAPSDSDWSVVPTPGGKNQPSETGMDAFTPDTDGSVDSSSGFDNAVPDSMEFTLPSGTLRRGDTGSKVRDLQKALVEAGYKIEIDGQFGGQTEQALRQFQNDAGITSDGIYGPQTRGAFGGGVEAAGGADGASGSGGTGGSGGSSGGGGGGSGPGGGGGSLGDGSSSIGGAPEVHSIPTDGELWQIDGNYAVAYQTEDGGPWIYYTIPDKDALATFFPSGTPSARKLKQEEADRLGAISPGSAFLLTNTLGENWEEGFNTTIERESSLKPWLKDPEVLATFLSATLEGRNITKADLESTEYFSGRSDAEIDYVEFMAQADSDEAEQYHIKFEDQVRKSLIDAGVRDPNSEIVKFISRRWASGEWTDAYTSRQIIAMSNPYSSLEMDSDLKEMTEGVEVNTLAGQTQAIRDEVVKWLGPQHGNSFSDEWYRQWAGSIMNDKNAENDLKDFLKGQRMALYPEYENPNLTYQDISGVWQNQMQQVWGISPSKDEHWGVLDKVIRANNAAEAGDILRKEGLNRGIEQVQESALRDMGQGFGSQVANI